MKYEWRITMRNNRLKMGLSVDEYCGQLGMGVDNYIDWCDGKKPTIDVALVVAQVLGISLDLVQND